METAAQCQAAFEFAHGQGQGLQASMATQHSGRAKAAQCSAQWLGPACLRVQNDRTAARRKGLVMLSKDIINEYFKVIRYVQGLQQRRQPLCTCAACRHGLQAALVSTAGGPIIYHTASATVTLHVAGGWCRMRPWRLWRLPRASTLLVATRTSA